MMGIGRDEYRKWLMEASFFCEKTGAELQAWDPLFVFELENRHIEVSCLQLLAIIEPMGWKRKKTNRATGANKGVKK
jgi:hypothetical protein